MNKWMIPLICFTSTAFASDTKVLAFAGSTRADSSNKKLVSAAAQVARQQGGSVTLIDLKDYAAPYYDGDLERTQGMPPQAKKLRDLMIQNEVILIATPEYNGSVSAVLKNALDWASRNEAGEGSREAFKGKKFILMSASPGPGGGARALANLRTVIENVGGTVVGTMSLPSAEGAFNDQGQLQDPKQQQELNKAVGQALSK